MIHDREKALWLKRFSENLLMLMPPNMSQREFAARCGINEHTLGCYISGRSCPSVYTVVKIARALGRPITDIVDFFY